MNPLHVIYMHSHDSGRWIQPYGAPVTSPRLQGFAEDAVLFRQAFSSSPACSPSRASLLLGRCAHSAGMLGLANFGFRLPDYSPHIIHHLGAHGYESVLAGIQHVSPTTEAIGYDRILKDAGPDGSMDSSQSTAQRAIGFLEEDHDRPFFLDVGFFDTHRPYGATDEQFDPRWAGVPAPLPDSPALREDASAHQTSLARLDAAIGTVLDAVDRLGLRDSTIVIVTTDHGLAWPGMKTTLYDSGIGVFLMMRGPQPWNGGRVVDSLVSQIDVYPTLCDLLGVPIPDGVQGVSLTPLVDGSASSVREELFAEINFHVGYDPQRCIRTDRWKYIRRYLDREHPMQAHTDPSLAKAHMVAAGLLEQPYEREQLFDLALDPYERVNLIGRPECEAVAATLRSSLDRWQHETDDPILVGVVPPPEGAVVHNPDDWEPEWS